MTKCVFVQLRCKPGTTYKIADGIASKMLYSELHSTSGDLDFLVKIYIPDYKDIGRYINDELLTVPSIEHNLTTLTFQAF